MRTADASRKRRLPSRIASDQSNNLNVSAAQPVRLVNYLQQPEPGGSDATVPADQANDLGTVVPNVPGLEDLEVQTLPDLDVIILRGRDQDVEQLTKIIRELERLSAETKPRIYIYPLMHTLGSSMAQIIDTSADRSGGRTAGTRDGHSVGQAERAAC